MNKKKIEYRVFAEMYDFDFEQAYYDKLKGHSWDRLCHQRVSPGTMKSMMADWCADHGKSYEALKKWAIIDDPELLDKGKIGALRKAKWSIKDICIDCNCTERVVKEILNEDD